MDIDANKVIDQYRQMLSEVNHQNAILKAMVEKLKEAGDAEA